jgi:hypothetical protein
MEVQVLSFTVHTRTVIRAEHGNIDLGRTAQHRQGRKKRALKVWLRLFCRQLLSCHSSLIITPWFGVRCKFENKRNYVWHEQVSGQLYALTALPRGQNPRYPMDSRFGLANVSHDRFLACASQFINHSVVNMAFIAIQYELLTALLNKHQQN